MLTRWHYVALLAPLLLFALEWRRNRPLVVSLLFSALILGATQGMVDLRIRAIRELAPRGMGMLDPDDPLRRHFGMLHGISMTLIALQVLLAGIVVLMNARKTVHVEELVVEQPPVEPIAVASPSPDPEPTPVVEEPPPTVSQQ